jgi:predicted TIM-barrel fold metal-dependent hydrolase
MSYDGPIVDVDVHQNWAAEAELTAYLPAPWRELAEGGLGGRLSINPATGLNFPSSLPRDRAGTVPPTGGPPGSDYPTLRRQLLEEVGITRALLQFDTGLNAGVPNPYFAAAVVEAANRWSVERWLEAGDPRLYGAVLTTPQLPEESAAEVRRAGVHARMVEVLMTWNAFGRPFGHPVYHPIYAAAAELGLPVAIHIGMLGQSGLGAGGRPSSRLEFYTEMGQAIQHHLVSFITHGVFERFPGLRLLLLEVGVAWLPWLTWQLDAHARHLRAESPWIRRDPSEYIRRHVLLSTQPLEMSAEPSGLIDVLEAMGGVEELLMFSTDYPHWDADDPKYVARRLPAEWLPKVFFENACRAYGWRPEDLRREAAELTAPAR